ncbi:MAG: aldehyde dehydrogenase family protein [Ignavibacteriaceae bacterium]|jgi:aldehyde dehydrogenase (NAD+)|nr:aldehyde dehydrogenase family protein [Ignavibacteriaceae bacterium]MCW8816841.1 aldehyde dehydrogenase family protein [Ignavibacteriaceae bacterium]MCW8959941.1 aldehyde dehydrogenase family protein [Ignavibacteriaceae bacterium]MCW9094678.1 aldehyde dehydrogenase family protein [Ignavibacteriaceae bacterium]MCW9096334.1 aldehyde dehydrogenase family protein [Ignavibacteriaceae bacterium]
MDFLKRLDIQKNNYGSSTGLKWNKSKSGGEIKVYSPVDGKLVATVYQASEKDYEKVVKEAEKAFKEWRMIPAPKRGEIVRQIGNRLREYKEPLGTLVSYEMGKSLQEGLGEVQEMIDICDFAVGQSRQLYGFTMQSERPMHRMYDQYHPLGIVCTISAFNFPVAVWSWNAMIAAVCGDVNIWKPSSKVPLTAIATQKIIAQVLKENNLPEGIFSLVIGKGSTVGERILKDKRVQLISVTGSTKVGQHAAEIVAARFGKTILELGGNNAIIITPDADLKLAIPAVVFGAVGTAGQRCTTTRRLIIYESIYNKVRDSLLKAYKSIKIGNPLNEKNHMGPLINTDAVRNFENAIKKVKEEGGKVLIGGEVLGGKDFKSGCYVTPAIVEAQNHYEIVQEETFAPILYLIKYKKDVDEAISLHNGVVQGLSSAIFTNNIKEAERFLSCVGSDCGIANVNIGTSGAEIGGAFGGEKETGGGRESGSDAWKAYMRRQTNTINFGSKLPLAQGIKFDI